MIRSLRSSLVLTALLLGACGDEPPGALVASAKEYLAKKDANSAVIQLKSALQKQPDLAEARFLLGRTLVENGDAVPGEIELRKALDLKYPKDAVLPLLARALVMQGKGERAIKDYATTQLSAPVANADLKTAIAGAYAQQGDLRKAQSALDDALRAAPDFAPAHILEARLKVAAGDSDGALALLDRVIKGEPGNYEALQLKGDLLFVVKKQDDAAVRAVRQALKARPDWLPARVSLIDILLSRGDLAGAKTEIDALKRTLPNHPQTRYFEARLAFLKHDYKSARELVQPLVTGPSDLRSLILAGATELRMGSLPQAESYLAKALQRWPDVPEVRRLLAQVQVRSDQPLKARETLRPLVEKADADAESLNLAAEAELQLGEAAKAEALFGRAQQAKPDDPRSGTALALAQFSKGRATAGYAKLEEIAASDTGTVADMALISAHLRQNDYEGALKAIDSLEHKQPDKPFASQLRGQVELSRRNLAGARQSFERAHKIDPLYFPAIASLATLDVREGKPEAARKRFDDLLAADPKNVQAMLAIADLRSQAGASKEELAALLGNAIKVNPTLAPPRVLLIELHLRNKDNRAALNAAQEGVAAVPDSPELLDALGRAQMASGESAQAISTFIKVAALRPRSPQPQIRLAEAYRTTNNLAAARESLQRALEVAPKYLPAQRALITLELAAGRPEPAMAVARAVQTERPDQSAGYVFAGDIELWRKNWDGAAAAFATGLKRDPTTELAAKRHGALMAGNRTGEAQAFATAWIKEHPQDAAFRTYLGDAALAKLDFRGAETEYLAVLKLQPDDAVALNNLAWLSHTLKKPGAIAYAERANTLQPGRPAFMDTLAVILGDSGQLGKAVELQQKVVALEPDYPPFRLNLAKLYIKSGDKTKARIELDQLAKLGDKFAGQPEVGGLLKAL
jgi:putative PEP-CTERM system TPR-repeat lipoprotein